MKMEYTDPQRQAIEHRDGNLLIIACAGSGKTEVISRRIASLVREGARKNSIIAFTFTEQAADELKARIRRHLEELVPDDPSLGDMYVGTIHSFCLQLLKEIDPAYRRYEVMDEVRQSALIMTRFYGPDGIGLDRLREFTRGGRYWETVRVFISTLNVIHQIGLNVESIPDSQLRESVERYKDIAHGYPNYFYDFNSIIGMLLERLQSDPAVLNVVREKFSHLVVDEYQDVDSRQEELIRILSDSGRFLSVTVVGDDDQSIYGWRGARVDNILRFRDRYPNVTSVNLVSNFRSTHAVVEIANKAIRRLPAERRLAKSMIAHHWGEAGLKETLAESGDVQVREFDSEELEAEWIADRVIQLRGTVVKRQGESPRGIDYADMAILLRSVRSSGALFSATLANKNIPVVVKGIGGLFKHDEVRLFQAGFCLLARSEFLFEEEGEFRRFGEVDTRQFVRSCIQRLRESGRIATADEHIFLEWVARKREELDRRNLSRQDRGRLARRIYPQSIFQEMLEVLGSAVQPWRQDVLFNLGRLSGLITQFEAVHQWVTPRNLVGLCIFLGGWAAGRVDEGGLDESGSPNAVQIMTVHAAKGLEWPVVFLPRISSSNFPSNLRSRGPETFLSSKLFDPKSYAVGNDGERRLWYVAITRCQKFLNITSPSRHKKRPTEFFREIEHDIVQRTGTIRDREKSVPKPPSNVELLPTTHTALSYYRRCPYEYQLRELMGFGPGVKESYGYGQQMHNILAEIHKRARAGEPMTVEDAEKLVEERFHLRYTRDGNTHKPLTILRDAAKRTIARYMELFPDTSKYVLDAEKPFEFVDQDSGALISGTIDLLEKIEPTDEGEIRVPVAVLDFKTHRFRSKVEFERARANVEAQLQLYAVAVREALGFDPREARAHFLSPDGPKADLRREGVEEVVKVDVSSSRKNEAMNFVRSTVEGIRQSIAGGSFEMRGCENGHCENCDYKKFCPGFKTWRVRDQRTPNPLSFEEEREREIDFAAEDAYAG